MILKLFVLLAAIAQVVAAALLPIGSFEQSTRPLDVFIQPASWAFSIWGLIYTLSFIYAVYQLIPKNDSELLQKTRLPALLGFLSSIAWLFFAGQDNWLVWCTFPTLLFIALCFSRLIPYNGDSTTAQIVSRDFLLPYGAWATVATWLNAQTLLVEEGIVTTESLNLASNLFFFAVIVASTLYGLRRTKYNLFYGGILIWASVGVVAVNLDTSIFFASIAGLYAVMIFTLLLKYNVDLKR